MFHSVKDLWQSKFVPPEYASKNGFVNLFVKIPDSDFLVILFYEQFINISIFLPMWKQRMAQMNLNYL